MAITTVTGSMITPSTTLSGDVTVTGTMVMGSSFMRNRIINGDMRIDQRNAGASVTANAEAFPVDRFKISTGYSSKATVQQSTTAPTGFNNSILLTSTAATSTSAGDYMTLLQVIEGLNIADLGWGTANAKTVTLSFWVRSSLTGTFGGAITNSGNSRSYVFSYTISAANTWEQKTVTITGDTSGTWLTTNGIGLIVRFSIAMGSTYSNTAGSWYAGDYEGATGQTQILNTNGATFYITGVQLEIGTSATPFERRLYTTELQLCQRYFEKSFNISQAVANGTSGTSFISGYGLSAFACSNNSAPGGTIRFAVQKRTDPTMTLYGNNSGQWSLVNPTSSTSISWTTAINLSAGDGIVLVGNYAVNNTLMCVYGHWTASAEL